MVQKYTAGRCGANTGCQTGRCNGCAERTLPSPRMWPSSHPIPTHCTLLCRSTLAGLLCSPLCSRSSPVSSTGSFARRCRRCSPRGRPHRHPREASPPAWRRLDGTVPLLLRTLHVRSVVQAARHCARSAVLMVATTSWWRWLPGFDLTKSTPEANGSGICVGLVEATGTSRWTGMVTQLPCQGMANAGGVR